MLVNDLHYFLCRHGWQWEYTRGSHRHYRHTVTGQRFQFAVHGRKLEPQQVKAILRELNRLDLPLDVVLDDAAANDSPA